MVPRLTYLYRYDVIVVLLLGVSLFRSVEGFAPRLISQPLERSSCLASSAKATSASSFSTDNNDKSNNDNGMDRSKLFQSTSAASSVKSSAGASSNTISSTEKVTPANVYFSKASTKDSRKDPSDDEEETSSQSKKYELPWDDTKKWALRDNIAEYTIQVPVKVNGQLDMRVYTLWRNLAEDVPQLTGYPLSFLLERYIELAQRQATPVKTRLEILPFLDEFDFETNGGLTGRVYGVPGVADGTLIRTTPVNDVRGTIPKRFVRTEDGGVIYELGKTASEVYSLTGITTSMAKRASDSITTGISKTVNPRDDDPIIDDNMIQLASLTAFAVGSATLVNALSHHLTVNMFWV